MVDQDTYQKAIFFATAKHQWVVINA